MQVWSKSINLFIKRTETIFRPFKSAVVTLEIRSRSPKSNQLVPPPSQQCIYASLVKIHQTVQKIKHGKEATRTRMPTGSAPKTICPPPPPFRFGGHNDH